MSMLAEKKRKQKWSLNPRGKDWAQDANKFGQKMLEKMGWQLGKGLGARENGITEHVKVSYKNDSKGMGYKESNDQWTEHETNFTALLESLSGSVEKPENIKVQSLEKKSETSRARVHYHKFTRGKDLSRYSEKDLANIFGKKSLKESVKHEVKEEVNDSNMEKLEKDSRFIVNAGSMRDYFKKKLPNLGKNNGYFVGSNGVLKKDDSESEVDVRPSFKCNNPNSDSEGSNQYAGFGFKNEINEEKSKKKKKRTIGEIEEVTPKKKSKTEVDGISKFQKRDEGFSNPAFNPLCTPVKVEKHILTTIEETMSEDIADLEESSVTCEEVVIDGCKTKENGEKLKKHKTKKKKEVFGIDNTNFEEAFLDSIDNSQSVKNPFEVSIEQNKKKNKKKDKLALDNPTFNDNSGEPTEPLNNYQRDEKPFEVQIEVQKKKKSKEKFAIENPSFSGLHEESLDISVDVQVNSYEVKKKKKKKYKLVVDHPSFNASEEILEDCSQDNPYEVKLKKKEKRTIENLSNGVEDTEGTEKKRTKRKEIGATEGATENLGFNESAEESSIAVITEENCFEVKRKKRKPEMVLEDSSVDASTDSLKSHSNSYEAKKKKKKKDKKDLALENPAFNDVAIMSRDLFQSAENVSEYVEDAVENNVHEVKRKKKKSKKRNAENGITNPGLDLETSPMENIALNVDECDLMLNIVTTPILNRPEVVNSEEIFTITKANSVKRRKSVRFSDVTEERIIPNNDDLKNLSDIENRNELFDINTQVLNSSLKDETGGETGLDNLAFDRQKNRIEEKLDSISKTLDRYQAEIENDINEKKLEDFSMDDVMVGEVGTPHGENEKMVEGTKLKFKYAHFLKTKTPIYHLDKVGPRKGYRHLIKGDIVVKFNNTNLHQIDGYGIKNKSAVS